MAGGVGGNTCAWPCPSGTEDRIPVSTLGEWSVLFQLRFCSLPLALAPEKEEMGRLLLISVDAAENPCGNTLSTL